MKTEEKAVNPLMIGELVWPTDQKEWRELWDTTTNAVFLESLLYRGPKLPDWDIGFYLEIADGVFDHNAFRRVEEEEKWRYRSYPYTITIFGEIKSPADVRRVLASVAYKMLCLEFFKNRMTENKALPPSWYEKLLIPEYCGKIIHFFRPRENGWPKNLPYRADCDKHPYDIAYRFVSEFAKFAWYDFRRYSYRSYRYSDDQEKLAELFERYRPKILEILWSMGELDYLLSPKEHWPKEEEMEVLKQLAFRTEIYEPWFDGKIRPVATVAEALFAGSQAAEMYLLLRTKMKEHARLEREGKLRRQRDEIERELRHPANV